MAEPLCRWCGEPESEHGPAYGKPVYGWGKACEWDMQSTLWTPETRPLVAAVERSTGLDVVTVEEKAIAPLLNGKCHWCGTPIRYISVAWCDACIADRQTHRQTAEDD